jgi:hypothetical protein
MTAAWEGPRKASMEVLIGSLALLLANK